MDLAEYCAAFDEVQIDFENTIARFGLPFENEESQPRAGRAALSCARCENGSASIVRGWMSSACRACRTGEETATFLISLKCTRDCYFCFNPNQENYEFYRTHERDITNELRMAHASGAHFHHLAVTGGEPCLHPEALLAFVHCAKELYPEVHVRLYTNGDVLSDALLDDLRDAGLNEVRFSIKPECSLAQSENTLQRIAAAVVRIPDVMVEMPVIPHTFEDMKTLLLRLDSLGVRGINLLEFCFPLTNAEAFAKRGFTLRRNPYVIPYNYWYAGGLPVAGSETECLLLLQFADKMNLRMGVHYCSLDNKLSGQIYQQNKPFLSDDAFSLYHAWLSFDTTDYFLKCAKVFGADVDKVVRLIENMTKTKPSLFNAADGMFIKGILAPKTTLERRYSTDKTIPLLAFPLAWTPLIVRQLPHVKLGISYNVLESQKNGYYVREVALLRTDRQEKIGSVGEA